MWGLEIEARRRLELGLGLYATATVTVRRVMERFMSPEHNKVLTERVIKVI